MKKPKNDEFEFVQIHPQPCTAAELREHLLAYIDAFVVSSKKARCRLNLVDKPDRADDEMRGGLPFDGRYCHELSGRESWPQHIERHAGSRPGVYWEASSIPMKLRPSEASSFATEHVHDALLSIVPGRLALFFNHESQVWLCKR